MNNFIKVNTVRPLLSKNQIKENHVTTITNQLFPKHAVLKSKGIIREFGKDLSNISHNISVNGIINDDKSKNYKRTSDLINKYSKTRRLIRKDALFPKIKTYKFKQEKKIVNPISHPILTSVTVNQSLHTEVDSKPDQMDIDTVVTEQPVQRSKTTIEDTVTREDPQKCSEYFDDIYTYLKEIDMNNLPLEGYMEKVQNDVTEKMRSILLDWLVEVHLKFKLLPETFYLTVNLIDRYLSKQSINRKYLQLLGVTAMFIACKYEEIYSPEIKDFIYMTDNAYTREQMIKMEFDVLKALEFNVTNPSPLRFLEILKCILKFDDKSFMMCQYFLELCITDYKMIKYNPGLLATCVVYIEEKLSKGNQWNGDIEKTLWEMSGFNKNDMKVKECLKGICFVLGGIDKSKYIAIKKKYSLSKFHEVSKFKLLNEEGVLMFSLENEVQYLQTAM